MTTKTKKDICHQCTTVAHSMQNQARKNRRNRMIVGGFGYLNIEPGFTE